MTVIELLTRKEPYVRRFTGNRIEKRAERKKEDGSGEEYFYFEDEVKLVPRWIQGTGGRYVAEYVHKVHEE